MGSIVISGASGDLGRRVTDILLAENPEVDLRLVTRAPAKLAARATHGVQVHYGDYGDPSSLEAAYAGAETLLLISGLNIGHRVQEHRNAISAAQKAGIKNIVYTSVGGVHPHNPALSARDHYQSEQDLRACGLGVAILRDALYAEIVTNFIIRAALPFGEFNMAAGNGYLAPVSKLDVVRCVAACLSNAAYHAGATYEITGPQLLNMHDIARIGAEFHGKPIIYKPVSAEERLAFLDSVGLPRTFTADMPMSPDGHMWASDELVSADCAIAQGYQGVMSRHVYYLTGREPETLQQVFTRCKDKRYDEL